MLVRQLYCPPECCFHVYSGDLLMNITSLNAPLPESSLQGAYARSSQVASEIGASEHNKPQQVNAPAETSIDRKNSTKPSQEAAYEQPSPELPAEVPVNVPVSVALARSLTEELRQFPDIDQAKVAAIVDELGRNKFAINNDDLASAMLGFYKAGR